MRLVGGTNRPVALRSIARTGGDATLGIRGTEIITDTPVIPDPMVSNLSDRELAMASGRFLFGDLAVWFPPGVSQDQIEGSDAVVIGVLPYRVVQVNDFTLAEQQIMVKAIVRTVPVTT
jgi:hypothetical protein